MTTSRGTILLALALGWAACVPALAARGASAPQGGLTAAEKDELEALARRFNDKRNVNLLSGEMWTLTHAYGDSRAVDEVLNYLKTFLGAAGKKDYEALAKLGGAKGFKGKFVGYLGYPDDAVQSFAAMVLAVAGDATAAPHIAKLLRAAEPPRRGGGEEDDDKPTRIAGGRAAVALGLLGADEYRPELVKLLGSANQYDRVGAVRGLVLLKAKGEAGRIAGLLGDERESVRVAAIDALTDLDARDRIKEIAAQLSEEIYFEVRRAAAFALVRFKAKEYAKEIAGLLGENSNKGDAALALALLGAGEYAGEIAKVLGDERASNRTAAMYALGILRAAKYAPAVAGQMRTVRAGEDWVPLYAAAALLLMGSPEFSPEAAALLEKSPGVLETDFQLPPALDEEIKQLRERLGKSFAAFRGGAKGAGAKP